MPAVLTVTGAERRFASYKEVVIFRVIQELLANVRTHSHATRAQIFLDVNEDMVQATVEDNGSGFNVSEVLSAAQPRGIGLTTLRERVSMLGGDIRIDSAIGRGTKIALQMPI